jgi:chromosome partitioning protein
LTVRKIVILNPKGGSGKTTIATNLAAHYACAAQPPALMDYDSQGSSTRWLSRRGDSEPYIHGIASYENHAGQTRSFALRVPPEVQRVIVDTPAAFRKHELLDYVRGADKILVPVLPSEIDIHAATRTIADLLLVAKISRHEDRLAVVANRVKSNTLVFRALMKFLESLEIPVAAVLRDTQNYIRTASEGVGLQELKRADVTKDLIQWKRLVGWLESDNRTARMRDNPELSSPQSSIRPATGTLTLQ